MKAERENIRLAAMGDVMLARDVGKHIFDKPDDFQFNDIKPIINNHDIIFLNLENPVSTRGTPHEIQDPHVTFCCTPDSLEVLKNLHATVVSIGNNHMLDYGDIALHDTIEHLDSMGIKHVGGGRNYEEANRPLLMKCNGIKIAFLAYVFIYSASTRMATKKRPGISDYRINHILPKIRDLNIAGYQVIVSIHWGMEYSFYPIPYQMKQAREMIENGASLILGHGPHYPQGIENYKGGQIIYSLGNFIFDEPHIFANRSFIYSTEVTGNNTLDKMQIYPVQLINHVPKLINDNERDTFNEMIVNLNKKYVTKGDLFWNKINNLYASDIVNRIFRMKSIKFILLPPLSFFYSIGFVNYIKKMKLSNIRSIIKHIFIGKRLFV